MTIILNHGGKNRSKTDKKISEHHTKSIPDCHICVQCYVSGYASYRIETSLAITIKI